MSQVSSGTFRAVGRRRGGGRKIFMVTSEVLDDQDKLIAIGEGTFRYRSGSENPEGVPRVSGRPVKPQSGAQQFRGLDREVGQDGVGPGALEASRLSSIDLLAVEPAVGRRRLSMAYSPLT